MEKRNRKLNSQAGETIAETLVALLVAALALMMLGGAMSTASTTILKSKSKLDDYYKENENLVHMTSGTTAADWITIKDASNHSMSYTVVHKTNGEYAGIPVVAYQLVD